MSQFRSFPRFILLPSLIGWVCFACVSVPSQDTLTQHNEEALIESGESRQANDPALLSSTLTVAAAANEDPTATQALESASSNAYREGINLASSAYRLSQSAVSPDDWSLIVNQWQRAADQLKKVSVKDERYEIAQQKIPEYSRNADQASVHLQALRQSVNTPLPSRHLTTSQTSTVANKSATANAIAHNTNRNAAGGQIPIVRRLHGTPVVRVIFDGERSYDMILDTGASRTLITRQMATELGVVATERMVATTASATEVTFDLGEVRSISMGDITLQNARVSIGDAVSIGLLGNDFLRGYDMTIRENTVELVPAQ